MKCALSRRQFLKATAVASAATTWQLTPTHALGGTGSTAPSERVSLGVIGLGIQGTGNMRAFLGIPEVKVVAVCDVHAAQRAAGKQIVDAFYENSDCAAYTDFRELIARPDIDAVQITAPDHWHPLIAIEAARRGKHMYQEKPMGWSVRAAHAVERAVRDSGVVFQFGTQQRSDGRFRLACELVRNGRIGRLQTILVGVPGSVSSCPIQPVEPVPKELDYDLWLGPAPMAPYSYQRCRPYTQKDGWSVWYSISDYCMGMIGNWGVHHLDIAQWANNSELSGPVEIEGAAEFPKDLLTDCAVSWQVENRYANGVTLIHMDDATSGKHPLQKGGHGHGVMLIGTEGWVHVDRQKLDAHPAALIESKIGPDEIHLFKSDNHGANFIGAVKGRNKPAAPIDVAVRTDTLCNLQLIAATLRRKLRWDPEAERFADDPAANAMLDRPMRAPWTL
ncbi:MAG TPA: Gfo/Idh/MocA family oxidoreductase [Verrucomicrobiota bacterium]|nr:Gfo/Idh/MocA family oxidoreductase [Verrucomicrobiota bacterium]HRZ35506.1 Gfo/Idh/MocA family oxidoreductase [Candidatus Paceibacterota bacterium]HRZ55551.1 Gfo/Idh/MocA family oxidoreductase [Candidatus Paceibacterota bacterium]